MLKILLIDDNKADVEFTKEAANRIGDIIQIVSETKGDVALGKLISGEMRDISVVMLDLNMPGTNGWEVLQTIRNTPSISMLPVVIFTTSDNPDDVIRSYQEGAFCYIPKPSGIVNTIKFLKSVCNFLDYVLLPYDAERHT